LVPLHYITIAIPQAVDSGQLGFTHDYSLMAQFLSLLYFFCCTLLSLTNMVFLVHQLIVRSLKIMAKHRFFKS